MGIPYTEIDKNIERHILGACLTEVDPFINVSNVGITADDFFTTDHKLIFQAISDVFIADETTDPILVANQLQKQGDLNRVGGADYIYELQAPIVETESARFHAELLKETSGRRKMLNSIDKLKSKVEDTSNGLETLYVEIQTMFEKSPVNHKLEFITADELLESDISEIDWIVQDLIPNGLTILAGDAKIGKSFLCWNLALAVAYGGIAISEFEVPNPRTVTYVALEDPPQLITERLKMLTGENRRAPRNLNIMTSLPNEFKFNAIGLSSFENYLKESETQLLIVDTWKHVRPEVKNYGSAYDTDYEALIPVQKFAHQNNISLILVTHTRKSPDNDNRFNQIQGSMGVQAGCDTMLMLTKENSMHTLHVTGRRMLETEYPIELSDGTWRVLSNDEKLDKQVSKSRRVILNVLKDAGDNGLSCTDIVDLTGLTKSNVKVTLHNMKSQEQVCQPETRGKYFYPNGNGIHPC